MDQDRSKLPVSFTVNHCFETKDLRFLAITIDVLHTGLNFNGSIFEKAVVDANADSIKNTPVLGYIALNPDGELDFQGHKYNAIEDENGIRYVYGGSAYGVIPESCNYRWIEKICDDGISREFFQVDALLWTKFEDAVEIFERDGGKPQSMELELSSIAGYEQEDGTFVFTDFNFEGCCLLSSTDDSIQPAMINSSAVAQFSAENIATEIKNKLNEYFTIVEDHANDNKEVGSKMPEPINFTLNLMEQIEEIHNVLSERKFVDDWGWETSQYCFVDVQDDEVIVMDRADHYKLYGMKFSMNDDNIQIDFDSAVRKKTKYENFESGLEPEQEPYLFEKVVSSVVDYMNSQIDVIKSDKETAEENYQTAQANYEAIQHDYDEMKPKYDAYVLEEQQREAAAIDEAKDAVFAKFDEHLSDNEKYAGLKNNRSNYSLEDIQNQCAILFTEKNLNTNFSRKKNMEPMTPSVIEQNPVVEINSRYGILPMKN